MVKKLLAGVLTLALAFGAFPLAAQMQAVDEGPAVVQTAETPESVSWSFNPAEAQGLPGELQAGGTETGEYLGIQIDASAAGSKFSPRETDTQVNAGTVFTVPVSANENGAVLTVTLSGGSSTIQVGETTYSSEGKTVTIPLTASETDTQAVLTFTSQSYLAGIALTYTAPEEEFPGTPENVAAEDVTYAFTSLDGLTDATGATPADGTLEGEKGQYQDMKVDATAGKFYVQPEQSRVQVNAGTVLYLPAAYDEQGAVLLISGTQDGSTPANIRVNGESQTTNQPISLDMSDSSAYPQYVQVEFDTIAYVTSISLNYASDSDFGTPEVEAKDKVWDFTASSSVERPDVQGARAEFDGIQVDANVGKFSPRDTDTQVNAGTVLYIPVAPDSQGATITVAGNNYNNLTLTLNEDTVIQTGEEVALPSVEENTYIPLSFESADGTGSCYLTSITVDYYSDNEVIPTVVTVGHGAGYEYNTIQSALDANTSSANRPLVLLIAPGTYTEKVTVSKPWVSFQAMPSSTGEAVVIEESYYSSNTFTEDGTFVPQDDYDVGTDQSGTVLLTSNATGFSACGITFQNSYNVVDHTGEGDQTPAVAFGSAADKVYLKDCRFIGRQDTLYLHGEGARVFVEDCYIEGTVDFVFGDANAYFLNSELHMAYYAGRDTGYFTAANTKKGDVGLVFYDCDLTVADEYKAMSDSEISLGRPWQTEIYTVTGRNPDGSSYLIEYDQNRVNPAYENTSSAVTFVECTMDSAIKSERWNVWTRKDSEGNTVDVTYHPNVRFVEYNSRSTDNVYLDPADYPDVVLGAMERTEDAAALTDSLLAQMGFGSGMGNWAPSYTDYTGDVPQTETPADMTPPVVPATEPTEPTDPSTPEDPDTSNPENPGQPGGSDDENQQPGHQPETGDNTPVALAAAGIAILAAGMMLPVFRRKRAGN